MRFAHIIGSVCRTVIQFGWFGVAACSFGQTNSDGLNSDQARAAQHLLGIDFSDDKIEMMMPGLRQQLANFHSLREFPLSNSVPPALVFQPMPAGLKLDCERRKFKASPVGKVKMPAALEDLAFYSVGELGALIKTRQITSEQLTRFYLDRLKRLGPKLECVVTLTEARAIREARRADAEIAAGKYRGPLHGIPYGAKDLLATKEIPTTWGAAPFTNQVFDREATVIHRLEAAGAILLAKTSLGELAMGETWFGGKTRNPWNPEQGSSGSSAGSCAATAAGLIPFGIGSETLGSIVSPCDRCGVTGLRPSFGRVSRAGAMTLSWTMDKLGPICRTVEDCAIVFNCIYGPDGIDPTVVEAAFNYDWDVSLKKLRIGYLKKEFEKETGDRQKNDEGVLLAMNKLGVRLIPVQWPEYPVGDLMFILSTEAAAAFDELTRSGRDDELKQQAAGSWPNTFRQRRFVPAVEYIQAQRIRYLLIQEMAKVFSGVDVILAPTFAGRTLLLTNLTGHPCVVLPNGFTGKGTPTSVCFIGKLFGEAELLEVAKRYQDATAFHHQHPHLEL